MLPAEVTGKVSCPKELVVSLEMVAWLVLDCLLNGVASIPMLQTITFIALDGTESTASQNLIWTCGPDSLSTPVVEVANY